MRKLMRAAIVAVTAALVALGAPTVALAVSSPSPSPQATESAKPTESPKPGESQEPVFGCLVEDVDLEGVYGPPPECELKIQILTPFCDNDVPKLRYQVEAIGTPNNTVTITWLNPGGANVVYPDLPLSGVVLWPGAVEQNGVGVDWPGWRQLPDGTWVEGDEYDWVRPSVGVLFQVNPEMTVSVNYPPSSPVCLTNPPDDQVLADDPGELSATGTELWPLALGASAILVAGAVILVIARRRNANA